MPLTSLGKVSNSASRNFSNSKGTIANVNYGRIVGSYDNNDIAYNTQQINSTPTKTVNLPVSNYQSTRGIIY
jgi:hypothetical protein